jgi:hypothetical protein
MDQQLIAHLQTLQRVVAFQQVIRAELIEMDNVGNMLETHSFTNSNWAHCVERSSA